MRHYEGKYSRYEGKERKRKLEDLERCIAQKVLNRDRQMDQTVINQIQDKICDLETQLNDLYCEMIKKSQAYLQSLYYEHFEKCHSLYFKQGVTHHKYHINYIKDDMDCSITQTQGILKEFKNFYGKIYQFKQLNPSLAVVNKFFPPKNQPFLTTQEQNALSAPITQEELHKALLDMPNFKTPSNDGFTVEFFKAYWDDIKEYYFDALVDSLNKGEMGIDQRRGIITLLPKKGKDIKRVTNWRPITLLNVDYKIIAKVIATRLKRILHKLEHEDQRAFIWEGI